MSISLKERNRLNILENIRSGKLTTAQAAKILKLSHRQIQRILRAYNIKGASALLHGNAGRKVPNALPEELRQQVLDLTQYAYPDLNILALREILAEKENINISYSPLRRILLAKGISRSQKSGSSRRPNRETHLPEVALLIQKGISEDWLE